MTAALVATGVFGMVGARAATLAGTQITNQAAASYTDASGLTQAATSNTVVTVVGNVGSFTNSLSSTKSVGAGNTAYAAHILYNTGNFSDNFSITVTPSTVPNGTLSTIAVYANPSGNGQAEGPALCSVTSGVCTVSSQTVAAGGSFNYVVAYSLPGTATTPPTPYQLPTVAAAPVPSALNLSLASYAASASQVMTDTLNLVTAAAFQVTAAFAQPAVAKPAALTNWPVATSGGKASAASCAATVAGVNAAVAGCNYMVLTATYTNTGGAAGDVFAGNGFGDHATNAGFTYVPNTAVWSGASGVALNEASGTTITTPGVSYQFFPSTPPGGAAYFVIQNVAPGQSGTVSWVVLVNSSAQVGTSTTAAWTPLYTPVDCGTTPGTAGDGTVTTCIGNPTANPGTSLYYTILPTYGVVAGSPTSTALTAVDATAGVVTPVYTGTDPNNTIVATGLAGGQAQFHSIIYNTGNAPDTFNLVIGTGVANTFPTGTTMRLYQNDCATPLVDTNGDGTVDTGIVQAGANVNICLIASLPTNASTASTNVSVLITATSVTDVTKFDATRDDVGTIAVTVIDLMSTATGGTCVNNSVSPATSVACTVANTDVGQGTTSSGVTTTNRAAPGATTAFSLFIKNYDTTSDSLTLTAAQSSSFAGLAAGWSVSFGTSPVVVGSGATSSAVTATVSVPAGTLAGTYDLWFRASGTGSTGSAVSDILHVSIVVSSSAVKQLTLLSNNTGEAGPGATVQYSHTLSNAGLNACGNPLTVSAVSTAGWTIALFDDPTNTGTITGATLIGTGAGNLAVTLPVGGALSIIVRVFAPANALIGAQDTTTVTVTDPGSGCLVVGPSGTNTATDTTTVVTGQLRLLKSQLIDPACNSTSTSYLATQIAVNPAQCIMYQVVATNQGTSPVSNILLNDFITSTTTFVSVTGTAPGCIAINSTGTPVVTAPAVGTGGTISCSGVTTLQPTGSVTMSYRVKVK